MALRQLVITKKIEELRGKLNPLKEAKAALETRAQEIKTRAEELERAVSEVTAETGEEDKALLEGEVEACLKEQEDNEKAERENMEARTEIENKIAELEHELEELNKRAALAAPVKREKREETVTLENRKFFGMNEQERSAFFGNAEVKNFLERVRGAIKENRGITGGELLIPEVVLPLLRERTTEYSKLIKHVNKKRVSGNARQNIMGTIPEAIWVEQCGALKERGLKFNGVEIEAYKVGGFIPVYNAMMEDSDVDLAETIMDALAQSIGMAVDKAILYGTGEKMPTGIVKALETAEEEIKNKNLVAVSGKSDIALFKALVEASGAAKAKRVVDGKFWAMNEATLNKLKSNALSINAAGAIVTGQTNTMPVIGGAIETLEFIPDGVIVGGYGKAYPLAERAGISIKKSEEYRFIEDQTVFKATARYDGKPAIVEAFVAIGIDGVVPSAGAVTFEVEYEE